VDVVLPPQSAAEGGRVPKRSNPHTADLGREERRKTVPERTARIAGDYGIDGRLSLPAAELTS
jgi:hypothetical protein